MRRVALLAPVLAMAACAPADNDPGPGEVTMGEARALDEAAQMLEEQRVPDEALRDPGESPEAMPTAPPEPQAD